MLSEDLAFVSGSETNTLAERIPISGAFREGRRRDKDTWQYALDNEPDLFAGRGFTGHEYLPWFKLINMNGRLYDPLTGRFLSPDENVQMPDFTQNFNRYSYALNNPLKYTDPDGEFIFTAFLIGVAICATIDYGIQVGMNYANGYKGKDAWVNKVDFFDVAVSGAIGGLTAGWGASLKAGETVGKVGMFMVKNAKLVKAGEILLTSGVDITGEGWQDVSFNQFGQRAVTGIATMYASDYISKQFKKLPTQSIEQKVDGAIDNLPKQKHHFATNKNKAFTPQMEKIVKSYGLDLDGEWNQELMNHLGRHPNKYHKFVVQGMQRAAIEAGGNQARFIQLFDQYVIQVVIDNPLLLRKAGW